jgi:hypothetical protein
MTAKNSEILYTYDAVDILTVALLDVREDGHLHIGLLHDVR